MPPSTMFIYPTFIISYLICILYSIPSTASCLCRTAISHIFICTYSYSFLYICVYKVVFVKLLDYLLDITAWSELEAQAFRYTHINIC